MSGLEWNMRHEEDQPALGTALLEQSPSEPKSVADVATVGDEDTSNDLRHQGSLVLVGANWMTRSHIQLETKKRIVELGDADLFPTQN